ncbi:MAG: molybdopterin molybdotransferase MoeA [Proteobacteria bacterium]|nr:molybdopterin molybdotransferase MoeA [Pseudomonadota bacterium]
MNAPSTDFPTRLTFAQAQAIVHAVAAEQRLPAVNVPVARAVHAVLAQDVVAGIDLPSFDNSAMDGFALRAADAGAGVALHLIGEQFAGPTRGLHVGAGECLRITTGAPLPAGADAVELKENVRVEGDRVHLPSALAVGRNVRRAGEDVRAGDVLLRAGMRLHAAQASLAAAVGKAELAVAQRPAVAVFTTGDELREPGQPLAPGTIHDSNRSLLTNLLVAEGLDPVAWPILPDDPARMRSVLRDAGDAFDVVLTCGGVSAGEKDHLTGILAELGRIHFWKVRMRPGMPLLFGRLGRAQMFGLPGNPVAVLATFLMFARPLLRGLQGDTTSLAPMHAQLATPLSKTHDRREFQRGKLAFGNDGVLRVHPHPATGSHRLRAAADSDCLIVLPEGALDWPAGQVVEVVRY